MIKVDTSLLTNQAQKMQSIAQQLREIAASVASANRALNWNTSIDEKIRKALNNCNASVTRLDETASKLGVVLNSTAMKYDQTEQKNKQGKHLSDIGVIGAAEVVARILNDRDGDGKPDSNVIKPPVRPGAVLDALDDLEYPPHTETPPISGVVIGVAEKVVLGWREDHDGDGKPDITEPPVRPGAVLDALDDLEDPSHTGTPAPHGAIVGAAEAITQTWIDRNGDGKPDSNVIDIPQPGGVARDVLEQIQTGDNGVPGRVRPEGIARDAIGNIMDRNGDGKPDSNVTDIPTPAIDAKDLWEAIQNENHPGSPEAVIKGGAAGVVTEAIKDVMDRNGDGKPDSNVIDIPRPGGIAKDAWEAIRDQLEPSVGGTPEGSTNPIRVPQPTSVIDAVIDPEGAWSSAPDGFDAVADVIRRNHNNNPGDLIFPEEIKPPVTGVLDRVEEIFEQFFDSDGSGSAFRGGGGRSSGGGSTRSF